MLKEKPVSATRASKSAMVQPFDANNLGTMFGGRVMEYIDDVAALSAVRHSRMTTVTASMDSVDFLYPIKTRQAICLESFVSWTHNASMEVFVKVIGEDLMSGERNVCVTSFLSFMALDKDGKPHPVPQVTPETDFEKQLFETAPERFRQRKERRMRSKQFAQDL